jgi:hypothetical protein
MNWNNIWSIIEPYTLTVLGILFGGGSVYAFCRLYLGKVFKKLGEKHNNADIADGVAQRLAGKTMNIDVTAITKNELKKISREFKDEVESIKEVTDSQKELLLFIAKSVGKLWTNTAEEKESMAKTIANLENGARAVEPKEVLTVKIDEQPPAAPPKIIIK